jgi:hypothetical protein
VRPSRQDRLDSRLRVQGQFHPLVPFLRGRVALPAPPRSADGLSTSAHVSTLLWVLVSAPILSTAEIGRLRALPKKMRYGWQGHLLSSAQPHGPNLKSSAPVVSYASVFNLGRFFVYYRRSINMPEDFSVGLVFQDPAGCSYTLLRCNGAHPQIHTNKRPYKRPLPIGPHIHYLTAYYQRQESVRGRRNTQGDGFALTTMLYSTDRGALRILARKGNIESQGSLFP